MTFNQHVDGCDQCRAHPFDLCPAGARLLARDVDGGPPTERGAAATQIFVCGGDQTTISPEARAELIDYAEWLKLPKKTRGEFHSWRANKPVVEVPATICGASNWMHDEAPVTCDLPKGHDGIHRGIRHDALRTPHGWPQRPSSAPSPVAASPAEPATHIHRWDKVSDDPPRWECAYIGCDEARISGVIAAERPEAPASPPSASSTTSAPSTVIYSTAVPWKCVRCGKPFGQGETTHFYGITMPAGYTKPSSGPYHKECMGTKPFRQETSFPAGSPPRVSPAEPSHTGQNWRGCSACADFAETIARQFHPESDVGPFDAACALCGHLHEIGECPETTETPVTTARSLVFSLEQGAMQFGATDDESRAANYEKVRLARRALVAFVEQRLSALGDAAREINCAGPVAHRIRILRAEMSAEIGRLESSLASAQRDTIRVEWLEEMATAGDHGPLLSYNGDDRIWWCHAQYRAVSGSTAREAIDAAVDAARVPPSDESGATNGR